MTDHNQRDTGNRGTLSRRTLVGAMTAGIAIAESRAAMAQAERTAPPSTVTSPPRDFGPNGAPTTYFWDPDIIAVDPLFNQYTQPKQCNHSIVDWGAVVRGAGLERSGPVSRLERHSQ
jgi:gluconolactonase